MRNVLWDGSEVRQASTTQTTTPKLSAVSIEYVTIARVNYSLNPLRKPGLEGIRPTSLEYFFK